MLVLSRKAGQAITLEGDITITVSKIEGRRVVLAIDAPKERKIVRAELLNPDSASSQKPLPEFHSAAIQYELSQPC